MERIKKMKETLICWCEQEINCGPEGANIECLGKVVDMVKDLAEAEEKCTKAAYYSTVMDAMEGSEDHAKRYGYDNWRYSSSGRFAPKGHGSYGYEPFNDRVRVHNEDMDMHQGGTYRNSGAHSRYGYSDMRPMYDWSDKGMHYDEYKNAKRHYQESGKKEDLMHLDRKMSENITNVISQLREMSEDASPEMRKSLKMDMENLMKDINKMM